VATIDECRAAIVALAGRFAQSPERGTGLDRSVSAEITDLDLRFRAHLHDGILDEITETALPESAQIRLAMSSDDLVSLAAGELALGPAWLAGRVKVHASLPDMLRLRTML